jgi:transcriptional regulator with XRE-family HTH domain
MAQSTLAVVEPSVLRWARVSLGLTPVAAAGKIGVPDTRVDDWESDVTRPTIAEVRKAATVYKRPLGVFLPQPPTAFDAMRDFRRCTDSTAADSSPELHGEYRRPLTQREFALELADIDESSPVTTWRIDNPPESDEDIAVVAREMLLAVTPLPLDKNWLHGGNLDAHRRGKHPQMPTRLRSCPTASRRLAQSAHISVTATVARGI